jgi:hypothetical protein
VDPAFSDHADAGAAFKRTSDVRRLRLGQTGMSAAEPN